jgi:hypothetical protein
LVSIEQSKLRKYTFFALSSARHCSALQAQTATVVWITTTRCPSIPAAAPAVSPVRGGAGLGKERQWRMGAWIGRPCAPALGGSSEAWIRRPHGCGAAETWRQEELFLVAPQDRKEPSQRSEKLAGTNSISGQRIDGERRAAMEGVGGNWGREQSGSPG